MAIPEDYLERVCAGILGKIIGVYLGRPFEGWTYKRILSELGPISYYVNERLGKPRVVTDDDIPERSRSSALYLISGTVLRLTLGTKPMVKTL